MASNSILAQLGLVKKETVYMSVTPGVGLEMIQLDTATKTVKNYAYRPLEYNESLRQIADIDAFKAAVVELFNELRLNIKSSNIILNLPMVLFGNMELTLMLDDEAVSQALTSQVEQSYIFKRYDPVLAWYDASVSQANDMRRLFYSAIQKNVIEDIKSVFEELGATLGGIEVSLVSLLKALDFSQVTAEQMQEGISWNLMIINQNGYSICSMVGKNIVEYYEEPLAIKSFEGDEIYNAIESSAQITLMSYPANYLFVVSETDLVSAELLAGRLHSDGIVNYLENNDFKKQDVVPVSLEVLEENAHKISLEAIGVATGGMVDIPEKLNFLGRTVSASNPDEMVHVKIGELEFDISPNMAKNFALIIAAVLLIPIMLVAFVFLPTVVKNKQAQLDEINSKVEQVKAEVDALSSDKSKQTNFDVNAEIKKVLTDNRAKLMAYTALGESVPKKLWITYFAAKDDGKFDIKGEATNVEDIYTFFRNMKDSMINTQLRLHKLEMKTKSLDEAVSVDPQASSGYQFEVTNMAESEFKLPTADNNKENPEKTDNNQQDKSENAVPPIQPLDMGGGK